MSVAEIAQAGPFSRFPGCERWLCRLDGPPLELVIAGEPRHAEAGVPLHLDGEAAIEARLPGGPVRVLNVIARVGRVAVGTGAHPAARFVFALDDAPALGLARWEAYVYEPPQPADPPEPRAARIVWISA